MKRLDKTYKTAEQYIKIVEENFKDIELLESTLSYKRLMLEKTLAKLRVYKKRGIVKKLHKHKYEIIEK
jgi:hypothetical protein